MNLSFFIDNEVRTYIITLFLFLLPLLLLKNQRSIFSPLIKLKDSTISRFLYSLLIWLMFSWCNDELFYSIYFLSLPPKTDVKQTTKRKEIKEWEYKLYWNSLALFQFKTITPFLQIKNSLEISNYSFRIYKAPIFYMLAHELNKAISDQTALNEKDRWFR